jgi:phage/plasmid-associated DNA primase
VADAALAARLAEVAMAVVREVVREAVIALLCGPGGGAK